MRTKRFSGILKARAKAYRRLAAVLGLVIAMAIGSIKLNADTGTCSGASFTLPFTDVPSSSVFFCSIAEAYFSGLTNGTTSTTYSPGDAVPREQMAAFTSRTLDQSVKRSSRRAALQQFWNIESESSLGLTIVGSPSFVQSDGADLWVVNGASVSRVRASDGRLLETWTDASAASGVLCAMGKVFITGRGTPGNLYQIDPAQPAGSVTTVTSNLGSNPEGIAFDGQRIWTANNGDISSAASVSIVTLNPVSVTTVTTGFNRPMGILYDGANIWVCDYSDSAIKEMDSSGNILLSVNVGCCPLFPTFDGTNIWVPSVLSKLSVVRAKGALSGTVLATLTGNGLDGPIQAAFDGERILVTNAFGEFGGSLSLWKASDLTPIETFPLSLRPNGVCSDGVNFWFTLSNKLARF
ncbi:MAG TPA: S-layer homology domain-containing protein [Blastocatellia bacterium]|nr:S-layer homology domain-containing protein [Blastocatellia bacterium]